MKNYNYNYNQPDPPDDGGGVPEIPTKPGEGD